MTVSVDHHSMIKIMARYAMHKVRQSAAMAAWKNGDIDEAQAREYYRLAMENYDDLIDRAEEHDEQVHIKAMGRGFDDITQRP